MHNNTPSFQNKHFQTVTCLMGFCQVRQSLSWHIKVAVLESFLSDYLLQIELTN